MTLSQDTDLVGGTTLVGTKHDNIGRGVGEFLAMELLVLLEELHISTTALEAIYVASVLASCWDWESATYPEV